MRQEQAREEMRHMQSTPKINKKSRQLVAASINRGIGDLAERQAQWRQRELARREEMRKKNQEKELEAVQSAPVINAKSKKMQRRGNQARLAWSAKKAEKVAQARKGKELREAAAMKAATPKVSRGSAKILRKMKGSRASAASTGVGEGCIVMRRSST